MPRIPLAVTAALLLTMPAWAQEARLGGEVVPDPWAVERIVLPTPPEPAPVIRQQTTVLPPDGRHRNARRDELPPAAVELQRQMFRLLEEATRRERRRRDDD